MPALLEYTIWLDWERPHLTRALGPMPSSLSGLSGPPRLDGGVAAEALHPADWVVQRQQTVGSPCV